MPSWTPAPYSLPYIAGRDTLEQTPSTNEAQIRKISQYFEQIESSLETRLNDLNDDVNGLRPSLAGPYTWSPGNLPLGTHHLNTVGFVFNGQVGDVWTGSFSLGIHDQGATGGVGWVSVKLRLASGILIGNPARGGMTFETATSDSVDFVSWSWRATQANDYLIAEVVENPYGTLDSHIQATAINHGGA